MFEGITFKTVKSLPIKDIDYSNFFSVEDATGKVTVAADADLPLGVHILSLKATNATVAKAAAISSKITAIANNK